MAVSPRLKGSSMSVVPKIVLFAGACAVVLSVSSCSTSESGAGAPASSGAPASPAAATSGAPAPATSGVTAGNASAPAGIAPVGAGAEIRAGRQFTFGTVQSGGQKMLTVGSDGIVTLTDNLVDRALFVPSPVKAGGDKYLLKTAKMVTGGEAWCLSVNSPGGSASLNLKTAACDTAKKDQIFTFPEADGGKGRLIEVNGLFVLVTSAGKVIAEESGEGDGLTAFSVRDQ